MVDSLVFAELPDDVIGFKYPFPNLAKAIRHGGPIRIVAIGSSSTAGRANVLPYPYWLERYLRSDPATKDADSDKGPNPGNQRIDVINRGRGGEEANQELLRFPQDVIDLKPTLVIWQVGTNAVFHHPDYNIDDVAQKIGDGLDQLCAHRDKMDVMLIDPQYVTAMLTDDRADLSERMVRLIARKAELKNVNLFHRWALMRHWHIHNNVSLERMIDPTDPDQLHQSDASTQRFSRGLCDTILKAVKAA